MNEKTYPPPREPVRVLVGARRSGKTSALIRWQAQGTPRPQWPMWSRVVLVSVPQREREFADMIGDALDEFWTPRHHELMAEQLTDDPTCSIDEPEAKRMTRLAMRRSVLTAESAQLGRLRGADVEIAVDNADDILAQLLGIALPRQLTLTGEVTVL